MSRTDEPIRLRSLVARGSVLERGLDAAQSSGPTDEQLQALERRVLAGVAAGAAVVVAKNANSSALGSAAGWLSAGTTKLVVALVAAIAVGGGAVVAWHSTGRTSHTYLVAALPTHVPVVSSEPRLRPEPPAKVEAPASAPQVLSPAPTAVVGFPVAKKREKPRTGPIEVVR
ncbi:MAG TPA: hypothetical protein VIM14_21620, partial [Polyangia bacterium]